MKEKKCASFIKFTFLFMCVLNKRKNIDSAFYFLFVFPLNKTNVCFHLEKDEKGGSAAKCSHNKSI